MYNWENYTTTGDFIYSFVSPSSLVMNNFLYTPMSIISLILHYTTLCMDLISVGPLNLQKVALSHTKSLCIYSATKSIIEMIILKIKVPQHKQLIFYILWSTFTRQITTLLNRFFSSLFRLYAP